MAFEDDAPLYADRPEWVDVTPLEQYEEGLNPLTPILYTIEYKDASDYFRGIVKKGEKSPRVLELTETMIRLNPAHYTAWQYRYETLLCLVFPSTTSPFSPNSLTPSEKSALRTHPLISNELSLLDELATRFLKTYQVWHHRRLIVCLTGEWRREMEFIGGVFGGWEGDAKNYHTWSYRQWILGHFGGVGTGDAVGVEGGDAQQEEKDENVWSDELSFVESMLSKDVRNNSAWHHRFFVVWGSGVREGEQDREEVLRRELTYVKQKISLAPNNPSAWNYLRGVLKATATPFSSLSAFVEPYTRPQPPGDADDTDADDIVDLDSPLPSEYAQLPCVEALEFLADVYEEGIEAEAGEGKGVESAVLIWKSLAEEHDTIRKNYWQYRIRIAHALASSTQAAQHGKGYAL